MNKGPARLPVYRLLDLPSEPWRNGGGVTRTVARQSGPQGEIWRVSAAEISASGPFSRFAGMDRLAVLIGLGDARTEGALILQAGTAQHALQRLGDSARFDGEAATTATLRGPYPHPHAHVHARLWNVMTRRGRASAQATLHHADQGPLPLTASLRVAHIVLVLGGAWACTPGPDTVRAGQAGALQAGELLVLRGPIDACVLRPNCPGSTLLHTVITLAPSPPSAI